MTDNSAQTQPEGHALETEEPGNLIPVDWAAPDIPTLPAISHQLMKYLKDENTSPDDIARLIRQDPGLTIKVLRSVNSAFYALNSEVTSVNHATVLLGVREVSRIALASVMAERFLRVPAEVRSGAVRIWHHSIAVAILAQDFAPVGSDEPDLYTLGLLHDIGWLILLSQVPEIFNAMSMERKKTLEEIESSWGVSHEVWGARLAEVWELPEPFQITALAHHDPLAQTMPPQYLLIIHAANHLAHITGYRPVPAECEPVQPEVLESLGIDQPMLEEMEAAALKEKDRIDQLSHTLMG